MLELQALREENQRLLAENTVLRQRVDKLEITKLQVEEDLSSGGGPAALPEVFPSTKNAKKTRFLGPFQGPKAACTE